MKLPQANQRLADDKGEFTSLHLSNNKKKKSRNMNKRTLVQEGRRIPYTDDNFFPVRNTEIGNWD